MPDINININPTGEDVKIADEKDSFELDNRQEEETPIDDYEFMDKEVQEDYSYDFSKGSDDDLDYQEENPEKEIFKDYLISMREALKNVLEAEAKFKRLPLSSMFENGEIGSGVYMLTVAEVRDKLQKSSSLLSDVFNAFASIGKEPKNENSGSNFFTDEGYTASSKRTDSIGDLFSSDSDDSDIVF